MENTDYAKVRKFVEDGEFTKAEVTLTESLQRDGDSAVARILLARIYLLLQKYSESSDQFFKATSLGTLPPMALAEWASCYVRLKKNKEATTLLEVLHDRRTDLCEETLELVIHLSVRLHRPDLGQDFNREGRRRFCNNPKFWYASGNLARKNATAELAEMYFHKASLLHPENTLFRIALGQQQLRLLDYDAARATMDFDVSRVDSLPSLIRMKDLYAELNEMEKVCVCVSEMSRFRCKNSGNCD